MKQKPKTKKRTTTTKVKNHQTRVSYTIQMTPKDSYDQEMEKEAIDAKLEAEKKAARNAKIKSVATAVGNTLLGATIILSLILLFIQPYYLVINLNGDFRPDINHIMLYWFVGVLVEIFLVAMIVWLHGLGKDFKREFFPGKQ